MVGVAHLTSAVVPRKLTLSFVHVWVRPVAYLREWTIAVLPAPLRIVGPAHPISGALLNSHARLVTHPNTVGLPVKAAQHKATTKTASTAHVAATAQKIVHKQTHV